MGWSGWNRMTIVSAPMDSERAKNVIVDGLLQVHEHLAAGVVGGVQFAGVADPGDAAPGAAVVGLHEQRIADLPGDGVQVERLVVAGGGIGVAGVVDRVLKGHEHRFRHLEAEPEHRAVGRVLLHRLERERAVQQVNAVHQRDLLEPLPRVVIPVREPVDDQVVAGVVAQAERLDGDPLAVEGVLAAARPADRPSRRRISSNAVGQSSSVPSSSPIVCLVTVNGNSCRRRVAARAAG